MTSGPVPGDPDQVEWLAREYGRYAAGACDAARELRRIDTAAWVGPAGEAFRTAIGELPEKLERGSSSFARAAAALSGYARVLRDAQSDAGLAGRRAADADAATASWQQARATQARDASPYDPGADDRRAAEQLLAGAHERIEAAARHTAQVLADARSGAPHEPGLLSKAVHALGSFLQGAGEATWSLAELGWKLSPTYATVDPLGFVRNTEAMAKGLVYGVEHPKDLGKALIDYDTWRTDPARALGHLVPDLVLIAATAGAGEAGAAAGRAADRAEAVSELAELTGRGAGAAAREAGLSEEVATALQAEFGSPSEAALGFQGTAPYVGRDRWFDTILLKGHRFTIGSPFEGQFAAAPESAAQAGTDARAFYEGVQAGPHLDADGVARYRARLLTYEVNKPLPVAESVAEANPQFGAGGFRQYYLPKYLSQLVEQGYIGEPVVTEMTGLEARIPANGLALETAASPTATGGTLAAVGAGGGACR
jgi:hypothetical protein